MIFENNSKNIIFLITIFIFLLLIGAAFFIWLSFLKESNINPWVSVVGQPEIKLISTKEDIKNAFLQKYPNWAREAFDVSIDKKLSEHAIGTIVREKNKRKCFWFAVKINDQWLITDYGCTGYFGVCQNFAEYNFPSEITPDCWDKEQKILINTPNPEIFYNGLTIKDKEKIKLAFLDFKKDDSRFWDKEIYIKFNELIDKYLEGTILIGGIENYSAPNFLAVKDNNNWKVLYYGQENPPCKNIESYNFPTEMISDCWDGKTWIKR